MMPLAFGMPGTVEWIVILVVALLIFGKRLPEVMRNLGRSANEFKRGMQDIGDEIAADEPKSAAPKTEQDKEPEKAEA